MCNDGVFFILLLSRVDDICLIFQSVWNARHSPGWPPWWSTYWLKEKKLFESSIISSTSVYHLRSVPWTLLVIYWNTKKKKRKRRNVTRLFQSARNCLIWTRNDRLRVISLVLDISGRCYMLYYCQYTIQIIIIIIVNPYQDPSFIGHNDHYYICYYYKLLTTVTTITTIIRTIATAISSLLSSLLLIRLLLLSL